jgi:hypothetical protein
MSCGKKNRRLDAHQAAKPQNLQLSSDNAMFADARAKERSLGRLCKPADADCRGNPQSQTRDGPLPLSNFQQLLKFR